MHITILTLFPGMFEGPLDASIIRRAQTTNLVSVDILNIRDYASDAYKSVDDHPYGGGTGMILRVDVLDKAITHARSRIPANRTTTLLLDPAGETYTQQKARSLCASDHLILVCGHYEGIDERIRALVDEELSIGDYVLTGGEIPALVVIDSVVRLVPGVLTEEATRRESFEQNLLEHPQYTRPPVYKGRKVPGILLSGDHAKIAGWKQAQSRARTKKRRPDLLG